MRGRAGIIGRLLAAALAALCCLAACDAQDTAATAQELVRLLWEVDYRTFSAAETTAFAAENYAADLLESYLTDADRAAAGEAREEQLISHVSAVTALGRGEMQEDGRTVRTEKVRVDLFLEHYRPVDPQQSFFEEGREFRLDYTVSFVREDGRWRISNYAYEPVGEAFLPAGEKQLLPAEGRAAVGAIVREYLLLRYDIDPDAYDADAVWAFYEKNADAEFLAWDGITQDSLREWAALLKASGARFTLVESESEIGAQKRALAGDFYYWAEVSYTYRVDADAAFLEQVGVARQNTAKELLLFKEQNGVYRLMGAEYLEEEA